MPTIQTILPSTPEAPDDPAVSTLTSSRTWAELERNARRVAQGLAANGLAPGDRWALLAHNRIEWPELFLGNVLAGTRYVPLNWHLTVPELEYLLENSGATFLVVDDANEANGRAAAHGVGISDDRIIVLGAQFDQWRDGQPDEPMANSIAGSPLLYTGGTTGASKGVVRADTGVPIPAWVAGSSTWGGFVHMPETGTMLITTPLYHAFGAGVLGAALARRHRLVLRDRFDADDFLATVERERVTSAPLVPTLMIPLAKLEEAAFAARD
ncbi:MAG: AMP-binding protein, partial [Ilumatobacteraceae bacterium]